MRSDAPLFMDPILTLLPRIKTRIRLAEGFVSRGTPGGRRSRLSISISGNISTIEKEQNVGTLYREGITGIGKPVFFFRENPAQKVFRSTVEPVGSRNWLFPAPRLTFDTIIVS